MKDIELWGEPLAMVARWADVIAFADFLCREARAHWDARFASIAPMRLALVKVELQEQVAVFIFERTVGGRDNPKQTFANGHAVTRDLVDTALHPYVWQHPMRRAVQKLVAEVPALGAALGATPFPEHLEESDG